MKIPQHHQAIMPYLMLHGADRFITFTQDVFGAKVLNSSVQDDGVSILHAEIQINGCTIMFSEATEQWKSATAHLFIYVPDADETFRKAVSAGASVTMEVADKDYGRSGGITDPFGNTWWITTPI